MAALQGLRVGGQDRWSLLCPWISSPPRPGQGRPHQVQAALPGRAARQATVLRWALRGLALELAVWQGWLLEAGLAGEPLPAQLPTAWGRPEPLTDEGVGNPPRPSYRNCETSPQ